MRNFSLAKDSSIVKGFIASLILLCLQILLILYPNQVVILSLVTKGVASLVKSPILIAVYLIYSSSTPLLLGIAHSMKVLKKTVVYGFAPGLLLSALLFIRVASIDRMADLGFAIAYVMILTLPVILTPAFLTLYIILKHYSIPEKILNRIKR